MKKYAMTVAAVVTLALGTGVAMAQGHGGGGGGGFHGGGGGGGWQGGGGSSSGGWHGGGSSGWHGGSWNGGWHGGGWYGGHWHGGTSVVVGFPGYWPWYYPYYGYGYGYAYPYYAGYYGAPAYSDPAQTIYNPGPVEYMEKGVNDVPAAPLQDNVTQPGAGEYSYYCIDPAGYYPKVPTCTKPWLKVVPDGATSPRPR